MANDYDVSCGHVKYDSEIPYFKFEMDEARHHAGRPTFPRDIVLCIHCYERLTGIILRDVMTGAISRNVSKPTIRRID